MIDAVIAVEQPQVLQLRASTVYKPSTLAKNSNTPLLSSLGGSLELIDSSTTTPPRRIHLTFAYCAYTDAPKIRPPRIDVIPADPSVDCVRPSGGNVMVSNAILGGRC